ncbi:unnamed protein product [Plutella xylostella]|uniref:(diamondback moth) hypothetical protein n=1 Tax=Plutella xylostella TaxID=51655 RepID=A0A8S4FY63_PLUXY|nr:unnamed protein product [Plutella xylostella]
MPINHSPKAAKSSLTHYDSDPSISTVSDSDLATNVSVRNAKRKFGELQKEDLVEIKELAKSQDCKITLLIASIDSIKQQNSDIKSSLEFMSAKYDEAMNKIAEMEHKCRQNHQYILSLEEKLENVERNRRSASLEIKNIPKLPTENKESLLSIATLTGKAIDVPIKEGDIRDIFRVNTKSDSKPIVVELNSVILRDKILKGAKQFNKLNDNKLNTENLSLAGPKKPVYVVENLTAQTKKIYTKTIEFAKENGYKFKWTSHGKVYLRKDEGMPAFRIDTEADLLKLSKK